MKIEELLSSSKADWPDEIRSKNKSNENISTTCLIYLRVLVDLRAREWVREN